MEDAKCANKRNVMSISKVQIEMDSSQKNSSRYMGSGGLYIHLAL